MSSLETAITVLAQAIQLHAQATVEAAKIYAAAGANNAAPIGGLESVPADEPAPSKPARSKPTKTKPVETPADPDVEKEPVKEDDKEDPRKPAKEEKPAVDAEKVKDEIRAVFKELADIRSDLPIAVLKEQGQQRLSTVPADELAAVLLAARDKLKSVQATAESYE